MSFFEEIKRRKVFQVAAAYLVVAWIILQVVNVVNEPLNLPDWFDTVAIVLLALGFPVALVMGWAFDITPGGVVRESEDRVESGVGRSSHYLRMTVLAIIFLGSVLVANLAIRSLPPKNVSGVEPSAAPIQRFTIDIPRSLQLYENERLPLAISPDGSRIIFFGVFDRRPQLFSRSLGALTPQPINGSEGIDYSAGIDLSPDGRWVAFEAEENLLRKVEASGGTPITLAERARSIQDISWGPNGYLAFADRSYPGFMRVPESGGEQTVLTKPTEGAYHKQADFLPDGSALIYVVGKRGYNASPSDQIAVMSLGNGEHKPLIPGSSPHVTTAGQLIYFRDGVLWAARFDAKRLEVTSASVPVIDRVLYIYNAHYSISANGTLAYVVATDRVGRPLVFVDRDGNETELPLDHRPYSQPKLSPDGDRIVAIVRSTNAHDLWVYSISRGTSTRLTFEGSRENRPVWTPDGETIYFHAGVERDIYRTQANGSGETEPVLASPLGLYPAQVMPGGKKLLYSVFSPESSADIGLLDLSDPARSEFPVASPFEEFNAAASPDGQWLAYQSNESGQYEVYVRPIAEFEAASVQVSVGGGDMPHWGASENELFYWGPTHMMSVRIETTPEITAELPVPIFEHASYIFERTASYDYDPRGDRFLMVKAPTEDELPHNRIVIVQNWLDEVSRKIEID